MKKKLSRREALGLGAKLTLGIPFLPTIISSNAWRGSKREFNVMKFGAAGDGKIADTEFIQAAINKASSSGGGAKVILPSGHRFYTGTLKLKDNIEFHLAGDVELIISTDRDDYKEDAAIVCRDIRNVTLSGTGKIDGQALKFMNGYEESAKRWIPAGWRPRLFQLFTCRGLEVKNISFGNAPFWGLHMVGCEDVLIDNVTIRNKLTVPNSDGINPDHCRNVEIKNCDIEAGDDNIVVKTTPQDENHGPSAHIRVYDCTLRSKSSGIKIGTETTDDIYDIRFERCKIQDSNRACTIQSRDEGEVYDVEFRDIDFSIRQAPQSWWGLGEGISITSLPRTHFGNVGGVRDIRLINITGRAENSVRISGVPESRIRDILLQNVDIKMKRRTDYRGGRFDNRPTDVYDDIEQHGNPGFSLRHVDNISLKDCSVGWSENPRDYYTYAIRAEKVTGLDISNFDGNSAHPGRYNPVALR